MNDLNPIIEIMGAKWVRGACGPKEFDCWGLACWVQNKLFGRKVALEPNPPEALRDLIKFVRTHNGRKQWRLVESPRHGAMVEMAHEEHPFHFGVYLNIDGGGILHSLEGIGVAFDPVVALRASGWGRIKYYEWTG